MTGRRIAVLFGLLAVVVAIGGGFLLWSLQQVPEFYQEVLVEQPDLKLRKAQSDKFVQRTVDLTEDFKHSDKWSQEFTQSEVNAWLAEELHTKYAELIPEGVRDPRIKLVDNTILVGFHYSDSKYSGIISAQLRPFVIEPNRLAVEIQSVKAGSVPLPMEEFLERIRGNLSNDGWQVESAQSNGNQVVILRFLPSESSQPVLETVKIAPGMLQVAGSRAKPAAEKAKPIFENGKPVIEQVSGKRVSYAPRLADQSISD
jgi:hypothetical protein